MFHDECDCDEMSCKHVYRYADFVFVAVETIKARFQQKPDFNLVKTTLFWKTLMTTRTLIAHAFLQPENSTMKAIICENIKSLLALVDIDLTLKDPYAEVTETRITYSSSNWLNLYSEHNEPLGIDDVMKALNFSTYNKLKTEFDSMISSESRQISMIAKMFGHCCYHLVAKRDNWWKQKALKYTVLTYDC